MKKILLIMVALMPVMAMSKAMNYDLTKNQPLYSDANGYGYDFQPAPTAKSLRPFYFSVKVDDGNYKVTVVLGSKSRAANTTVRAESRRLFLENVNTKKGQFVTYQFVVNKRCPKIEEKESVPVYAVPSVRSAVTNISNYLPMETIEDFKKTVFQYFSKGQSAVAFNEWELGAIDKLRKEKYIRDEWIFSR